MVLMQILPKLVCKDLQEEYTRINALTPNKIWLDDLNGLKEHLLSIGWNCDEGLTLKPKKRSRKV